MTVANDQQQPQGRDAPPRPYKASVQLDSHIQPHPRPPVVDRNRRARVNRPGVDGLNRSIIKAYGGGAWAACDVAA